MSGSRSPPRGGPAGSFAASGVAGPVAADDTSGAGSLPSRRTSSSMSDANISGPSPRVVSMSASTRAQRIDQAEEGVGDLGREGDLAGAEPAQEVLARVRQGLEALEAEEAAGSLDRATARKIPAIRFRSSIPLERDEIVLDWARFSKLSARNSARIPSSITLVFLPVGAAGAAPRRTGGIGKDRRGGRPA